jgi:hypothetical protein
LAKQLKGYTREFLLSSLMSGRHIGPARVVTKKAKYMNWLWSKFVAKLRIQSRFLLQRFQVIRWSSGSVGLLTEPELLRHRTCCTLNYICNLLGM